MRVVNLQSIESRVPTITPAGWRAFFVLAILIDSIELAEDNSTGLKRTRDAYVLHSVHATSNSAILQDHEIM